MLIAQRHSQDSHVCVSVSYCPFSSALLLIRSFSVLLKRSKKGWDLFLGGQLGNLGQCSSGKHHYLCMSDLAGCCLALHGKRKWNVVHGPVFYIYICISQDESLRMENLKVEKVSVGQDSFFIAIR